MVNRATVTEDGGRASSGIDFFRCPAFLEAEGVTHTIEIGEGNGRITCRLLKSPHCRRC